MDLQLQVEKKAEEGGRQEFFRLEVNSSLFFCEESESFIFLVGNEIRNYFAGSSGERPSERAVTHVQE